MDLYAHASDIRQGGAGLSPPQGHDVWGEEGAAATPSALGPPAQTGGAPAQQCAHRKEV